MKSKLEIVPIDADELESRLDRIEEHFDQEMVQPFRMLIASYLQLMRIIELKSTTIGRLNRMLFGAKTERTDDILAQEEPSDPSTDEQHADEPSDKNRSRQSDKGTSGDGSRSRQRKPGHGRIPAEAYTGCDQVEVRHQSLNPGDSCPHCQDGTLYHQSQWKQIIRLVGQPLIGGTRYQLERLRCGLCGKVETAELPAEAGSDKYDVSVASAVAVMRYGQGLPWKRIEFLQQCAGIPFPASVQWQVVRDAARRGLNDAFHHLKWLAAQGNLVYNDDTTMRILELASKQRNNQPLRDDAPDRTGVFTTGILSEADGRPPIAIFLTGSQHAGENLRDVLLGRIEGMPPPIQMCDALSRNIPRELKTIVSNCLAHARRKFVDVHEAFPDQVREVLLRLGKVYRADGLAKRVGLSPERRLELHRRRSAPLMKELQQWLKQQLEERKVEPNSSLGQAIAYMLKHWEKLTLFLRVAGAPLDSNAVERVLKMAIRHRKNSLFYKTLRGAEVGDMYMSLIHTCILAKGDPFDYLTQLQRNAQRVKEQPEAWMPWNYRQQLASNEPVASVEAGV